MIFYQYLTPNEVDEAWIYRYVIFNKDKECYTEIPPGHDNPHRFYFIRSIERLGRTDEEQLANYGAKCFEI